MKRTYLLVISSVIIITVVIVLTLMQVRSVRSGPQASTPTPTYGFDPNATIFLPLMPSVVPPKITDLAPDLSQGEKVGVLVRHRDGTREEYMVAVDSADAFISNLPKDDTLLNVLSPIGSMGYAIGTLVEMSPTPTPTYGLDPNATIVLPVGPTAVQPKITDLAPDIPYEDKPSVVIRHADGSRERYLLAPDMLDTFIENLPKGDKLEVVIPSPSLLAPQEPPLSTPRP